MGAIIFDKKTFNQMQVISASPILPFCLKSQTVTKPATTEAFYKKEGVTKFVTP
jgi:hypothetical protein